MWSSTSGGHTYSKELGRPARERGPLHGDPRQPGAAPFSHREGLRRASKWPKEHAKAGERHVACVYDVEEIVEMSI